MSDATKPPGDGPDRLRAAEGTGAPRALSTPAKIVFSLGDHTVNVTLSALALLFMFFLVTVAGLRPDLAGWVVLLSRGFDAITDPLVGRFSDTREWRTGRRRPFFLIGMLPFAVLFALLWQVPADSQTSMFAYYTSIYVGLSLATTVLSVPYLALIPEMATDYSERTSLSAFRAGFAVAGTIAAAGMSFLVRTWGGAPEDYARAGVLVAVWLLLPWLPVYAVSFERADRRPQTHAPLLQGLRSLLRHRSYLRLCGIFIAARIAVDMSATAMPFYFAFWLGRREDFEFAILALLVASILSLPIWLRIGQRHDKHRLFVFGAGWWIALFVCMFAVQPEWPRGLLFALIALTGFGYSAADLMPWAMIGEVIDEDELETGERRAGIYNGFFTFMRKIAGAAGQWLIGNVLYWTGFEQAESSATGPVAQPESALLAVRILMTVVPAAFLLVAVALAAGYPLTRARHEQIRRQLDAPPAGTPDRAA